MKEKILSIRPFIGSENFETSQQFYRDLGFEEVVLSPNMSCFKIQRFAFYLQDAYVKDWIDNTMVFMEVDDIQLYYDKLLALGLPDKYENVRLKPIVYADWGSECFLLDPCGILWHFGEFVNKTIE